MNIGTAEASHEYKLCMVLASQPNIREIDILNNYIHGKYNPRTDRTIYKK